MTNGSKGALLLEDMAEQQQAAKQARLLQSLKDVFKDLVSLSSDDSSDESGDSDVTVSISSVSSESLWTGCKHWRLKLRL